jgi:hypothetical protein
VAGRLGWSKPTVRKYLPLFRIGGKVGVRKTDYENFLAGHGVPAKGKRS